MYLRKYSLHSTAKYSGSHYLLSIVHACLPINDSGIWVRLCNNTWIRPNCNIYISHQIKIDCRKIDYGTLIYGRLVIHFSFIFVISACAALPYCVTHSRDLSCKLERVRYINLWPSRRYTRYFYLRGVLLFLYIYLTNIVQCNLINRIETQIL